MRMSADPANGSLAADLVKGAVAGAAGVWVMDRVGWAMYRGEDPRALQQEQTARVEGKDVAHVAAGKLAGLAGVTLAPQQPHPAGLAVHYALGIGPAALYATLRRRMPAVGWGWGIPYGLALFLMQDEGLAPLLGLASGPSAYPWEAHWRGLVSHLVLGGVTHALLGLLDRST